MGAGLLQPTHIIFVIVIALLVFGPKRLPEMGRSIGNGIREFKDSIDGNSSPDANVHHADTVPTEAPQPATRVSDLPPAGAPPAAPAASAPPVATPTGSSVSR
jgi:sec-independent protein translocase protein TatA